MRRLRHLSVTVVLTLVLGTSAFAGTIECPPAPAPPPPSITATGITDTPPSALTESVAAPTDPVVDVTLNLLLSVLSLF